MQCMEVWGGNEALDTTVSMAGLQAWVYSQPYKGQAGGGDVHYLSSCATGRVTRLLVADVSGHGHAVADIARSLRTLMRRYVNFLDQTRLVRSLNSEFTRAAEMGTFATAVVATFWAPTSHLITCNAGHPRPLLYRARTGAWQVLKSPPPRRSSPSSDEDDGLTNLPLGIAEPTGYDQFAMRLERGDIVLFYTDSLIESRNPEGEFLTENGLLSLVAALDISDLSSFIPRMLAAIRTRAGGLEAEDDVTALLVCRSKEHDRGFIVRGLAAPFRIVAAIVTRLRLGPDAPTPFPEFNLPNIVGALIPPVSRLWRPRQSEK